MTPKILDRHIEITPDVVGGKPRIAGRRITVRDIVLWHERMGRSADEICSEHDLELGDIYAALAYYYDHRQEIDSSLKDRNEFVEELRRATPSRLTEKLGLRDAG